MYKKAITGWLKHIDFMLLDIWCLELSFILAYLLRFGYEQMNSIWEYQILFVMGPTALVLVTFFGMPYKGILRRGRGIEILKVFTHNVYIFAIIIIYLFLIKESATFSRMVVLVALPCSMVLMYLERFLWKTMIQRQSFDVGKDSYMVLITTSDYLDQVYQEFIKNDYGKHVIPAIMLADVDEYAREYEQIPVYCHHKEFLNYCAGHIVDEALIQLPTNARNGRVNSTIRTFLNMGVTIHIGVGYLDGSLPNQVVEKLGRCTVLTSSVNMMTVGQQLAKRLLDICGGIVGLLITGVLFVIFAPIIYKQSPGPIFFSQERVGKNGRRFKLYKFRSMYLDAEERKKELMEQNKMQGLMFKMDDDPRIIPIGKFIRKTSIDEFPQFFNVLKGDMSLVGTRPPTVDEYEQYEIHHKKRLASTPGITGLWQVSGRSDITDFEEVVRLDGEYIENWSIWLDIKILFKTVKILIKRDGAV